MKTLRKESIVKVLSTFVLSLVVLSSSLFAQPSFMVNDELIEEEIKIESWMTSYESFCESEIDYLEADIEIESWMTDLNEFTNYLLTEEDEALLAIEDWMINYNTFSGEQDEPLLAIENWMVDYEAFSGVETTTLLAELAEEELAVEAWMTNLEAFNTLPANYIPSIKTIEFDQPASELIALHIVK
ncbi:hypothetical protein [Carboxylicivirga sp. N1Y90]|uniref:hypothetical protein n=1 Tax=Carboxylicivirga fragile TaxID=3417571 RepID=UPI003D342470|nr:hypothetical protein [Marinilabiliaceae bacterium N1Y90]